MTTCEPYRPVNEAVWCLNEAEYLLETYLSMAVNPGDGVTAVLREVRGALPALLVEQRSIDRGDVLLVE